MATIISAALRSPLLVIYFSLFTSCNIAAGSYPYAERYILNVDEPFLIKAIQRFKDSNPSFSVPEHRLIDGRGTERSLEHWYHIYFYYEDENQIIHCWTRPSEKGKTELAFVGINQGLELGNWKMINKDFKREENRREKEKFEEKILSRIKKLLLPTS